MAYSKIILNGTTLMDVTQDTVTAVNLLSGETAHGADGQAVTGAYVPSGGSTDGDVIFIDYDGSIVTAKTKAEINAMSSDSDLPAFPSHTGLIAQGWNWTVAQLKAQLTAMPDQKVYVGQMYITESGKTEIDVEMQEGRLSPILTLAVNGTVTVDWGDNTTPDTVTGTSLTSMVSAGPHAYVSGGSYTIKIIVTNGDFTFYNDSANLLLRKNTTRNENRVYANCVQSIRIGSGVTSISNNAFYYCTSLASITIPSGVTSISGSAFYSCNSLANITIPSGVTSIGSYAFYNCYSLASITIPSDVTSIGNNAFYYCTSLASINIPSDVTSIGSYAFQDCYSLASITIPSGVTSIGNNAFSYCYGVKEYRLKPTVPPTLVNTNAFKNIASDCIIYVPQGKLSAYQSATNWSTYASYMQEEAA